MSMSHAGLIERLGAASRRMPASRTKSRIGRVVASTLAMLGDDPVQPAELADGTRLWLDARERTEAGPFWNGTYEPNDVAMLRASLRPGGDYVDVGAHVGLLALPLARTQLRNGGRVVAIEPARANAERLRRSLAMDPALEPITTVVECAVGAEDGIAELLGERRTGTGNAAILPTGSNNLWSEKVPVRTLDSVLADVEHCRIDAVKIDVEGYELEALRGATETIAHHRPVVYGEFTPLLMRRFGASLDDVTSMFTPFDYQFFTQTPDAQFVRHEHPDRNLDYVILVPTERVDDWQDSVTTTHPLAVRDR
jgi:FkbM family methyltransferase